jgi:predicted transcriptional regulator
MKIHKLLRTHRKRLGISQDELTQHIGFSHRSQISKLEAGSLEWKFRDVVKACELLKLEINIY